MIKLTFIGPVEWVDCVEFWLIESDFELTHNDLFLQNTIVAIDAQSKSNPNPIHNLGSNS